MKRIYQKPSASLFLVSLHLLSGSGSGDGEPPKVNEKGDDGYVDFTNPDLAPEGNAGDARAKRSNPWENE